MFNARMSRCDRVVARPLFGCQLSERQQEHPVVYGVARGRAASCAELSQHGAAAKARDTDGQMLLMSAPKHGTSECRTFAVPERRDCGLAIPQWLNLIEGVLRAKSIAKWTSGYRAFFTPKRRNCELT